MTAEATPRSGRPWRIAGSLRSNVVWQLLQTISGTGSEVAILLIFAARLPPAEFGALAVALSGTKIVFLLFEARIHEYLTPKLARYLYRRPAASWGFTTWSRRFEARLNVVALAVCGVVALVLPWFGTTVAGSLFAVCAVYAFSNTFLKFSSLAILRCLGDVRVAAWLACAAGTAKIALLGLCIALALPVKATVLVLCAPALAVAASQARIAARRLAHSIGPRRKAVAHPLRAANRARQVKLLLSNYATGLIEIGHREADVQLLAFLAGASEAGRYRVAKTLAMFMLEALNPVVLVLLPELARRLAQPARREISRFLRRVAALFGVIGLASGVAVAIGVGVYLHWLAPAQSAALVPALTLIVGFAVLSPTMWAQAYLVASGRPQVYFKASLSGALLAIALALALVARFGATGSALAHVTGLGLTCGIALFAAWSHVRHLSGGPRTPREPAQ